MPPGRTTPPDHHEPRTPTPPHRYSCRHQPHSVELCVERKDRPSTFYTVVALAVQYARMCRPTNASKSAGLSGNGRKHPQEVNDDSSNNTILGRLLNLLTDASILVYTIGFVFFRIGELIPLVATYPRQCGSALVGTLVLRQSFARTMKRLLHVASLMVLIYLMDVHVPKSPPLVGNSGSGGKHVETVVITGANSGVGYETAKRLAVEYGVQVVLGCRSESKCSTAANAINCEVATAASSIASAATSATGKAIPMRIDLADFDSVSSFATQLQSQNIKVDVLFNNAGYAPGKNLPVNSHGLDPAFTSMHLSHHLLTELLLKDNPSLRVISTSSATHHLCAIPFAYMPRTVLEWFFVPQNPGCVDEQFLKEGLYTKTDEAAYIQAKVANVMHAAELPRRHLESSAVAIDLGWVGTSIQPFMQGSLSPTSLKWMRSADIGILPVLHAIFATDKELLGDLGEQRRWTDGGVVMNVFGNTEEAFTYPWWAEDGASANVGRSRMMDLGDKLWDVSGIVLKRAGYLRRSSVGDL